MYAVRGEADDGLLFVHCPRCRARQLVPICDEWYEIEPDGTVFPDWVCMAEDRSCRFGGPIQIVNWFDDDYPPPTAH
jgi:hypothetical protein